MSQHVSRRGWAQAGFFALAITTNLIYVVGCLYPMLITLTLLSLGLFVVIPLNLLVGGVWAVESTRRRGLIFAWPAVLAVTFLPLLSLATLWPLRVGFWLVRPTFERMADDVAARVGPFNIGEVVLGSAQYGVGFLVEPNRSHPSGFVREAEDDPERGRFRSNRGDSVFVAGSNLRIHLGGPWWFLEDD